MNKFWGHLKTITHHRHLVMRGCFRMGLIWQGPKVFRAAANGRL